MIPRLKIGISNKVFFWIIFSKLYSNMYINKYAAVLRNFLHINNIIVFPLARIALFTVFQALFTRNSEILISAYNVPVVVEFLEAAGARLKFIDIKENSYNIDIEKLSANITSQTKGIVITHLYGKAVNFDKLIKLCKENNILIIEDAAQAFGSKYNQHNYCGTIGDIGVFSTGIFKSFTTFSGGFITVKDEALYKKIQKYLKATHRNFGHYIYYTVQLIKNFIFYNILNKHLFNFFYFFINNFFKKINQNLSAKKIYINNLDFHFFAKEQAIIGVNSFHKFPNRLPQLQNNMNLCNKFFHQPQDTCSLMLNYPVLVKKRTEFINKAADLGIDIGIGKFINFGGATCPHAEKAVAHAVNIPLHEDLTEKSLYAILEIAHANKI